MKQIVLKYDTYSTGTFTNSITADAVNLWCELKQEVKDTFEGAAGSIFHTPIARYKVDMLISLLNFESSNTNLLTVMKFISAPYKRIIYKPSSLYPDINGFTEFNALDNTINFNVTNYSINWFSNKTYKNVPITLESQIIYTL